jgi:hypothetical protein
VRLKVYRIGFVIGCCTCYESLVALWVSSQRTLLSAGRTGRGRHSSRCNPRAKVGSCALARRPASALRRSIRIPLDKRASWTVSPAAHRSKQLHVGRLPESGRIELATIVDKPTTRTRSEDYVLSRLFESNGVRLPNIAVRAAPLVLLSSNGTSSDCEVPLLRLLLLSKPGTCERRSTALYSFEPAFPLARAGRRAIRGHSM